MTVRKTPGWRCGCGLLASRVRGKSALLGDDSGPERRIDGTQVQAGTPDLRIAAMSLVAQNVERGRPRWDERERRDPAAGCMRRCGEYDCSRYSSDGEGTSAHTYFIAENSSGRRHP